MPNNIGVIYVLKNKAIKDFYKIGITNKDIKTHIAELNQTSGIAQPFELVYSYPIGNHVEAEKVFHQAFNKQRSKRARGFFKINPDDIRPLIEFISKSTVAAASRVKLKEVREKEKVSRIINSQMPKDIMSRVSKKQNTASLNRKFVERIKVDVYDTRPQISQNNYRKQEELSLTQSNPHRYVASRFINSFFIKK